MRKGQFMSQAQTLPPPPGEFPQSRRRWRLWLGVPVLLFLLALGAIYGFFLYRVGRDVREAMAEADRDLPGGWQLEALDAHRAEVPDEENAALVTMKVASLLPANWPNSPRPLPREQEDGEENDFRSWTEKFGEIPPEAQLDAKMLRALRESLKQAEAARAEARKLIGMTRGRFPLQWADVIYYTILRSQDARQAATLLRYEAALASQEGDADSALACVCGIIAAARAVGDEPTLISVLIRIACDLTAVTALERALAQGEPSARELKSVQALLEQDVAEPLFVQGMRGERAGMHKMLVSIRSGETSLAPIMGAGSSLEKTVIELSGPTLARRSHGRMLRLLNQAVAAAKLPPEDQASVYKALEQRVIKAKVEYDVVTALLMPAILKIAEANRRHVGNLRCAIVALAMERYRRDHGRWPDTLDALVPGYLAAVPNDPGDGKPLRLARRPDGVIVYWVGFDGTDDGGKLNRQNPHAKGADEGFQLWDVKYRRQPAAKVAPPENPPKEP
jgi:hypothetical protein